MDECDLGTQYHLARYAFLFESTLVADGLTLAPLHSDDGKFPVLTVRGEELTGVGPGVKQLVEGIDNREDFKAFMTQYALAWQMSGQRGPRRDGPSEGRNYVCPLPHFYFPLTPRRRKTLVLPPSLSLPLPTVLNTPPLRPDRRLASIWENR